MSGNLGVNGFNSQALDSLRMSFGRLAAGGHVKDGTIVKADRWTLSGVRSFKVVSGDYTGNLFRNADQVADNNTIRNAFLRSIANVYGGEDRIPESVRKAMKAGDFDGKGRPLTMRRIRATMTAITVDIEHKRIADAVETQDWCGAKTTAGLKKSPELLAAFQQYKDKLADDIFDAMKATILPAIEKGMAPSADQMYDFLTLLSQEDKPETKRLVSRSDIAIEATEVAPILDAFRTAAFSKALIRSEVVLKFFFSDSKEASEMIRNYKEAFSDLSAELDADPDAGESTAKMMRINCTKRFDDLRTFMVAGMSPNDILSLLMKMADEQANRTEETDKGNMTLSGTLDIIRVLPNADQREVANRFLRQIGRSVLDGTIRPRKPGGNDALYIDGLKALSAGIELCAKNRAANAKAGNHDAQPEFMMGSAELDAELQSRLQQINEETSRLRVASRGEET